MDRLWDFLAVAATMLGGVVITATSWVVKRVIYMDKRQAVFEERHVAIDEKLDALFAGQTELGRDVKTLLARRNTPPAA